MAGSCEIGPALPGTTHRARCPTWLCAARQTRGSCAAGHHIMPHRPTVSRRGGWGRGDQGVAHGALPVHHGLGDGHAHQPLARHVAHHRVCQPHKQPAGQYPTTRLGIQRACGASQRESARRRRYSGGESTRPSGPHCSPACWGFPRATPIPRVGTAMFAFGLPSDGGTPTPVHVGHA